jgi:lysophospholipase L1-like esterase
MKLLMIALAIPCLYAQTGEHWVGTWATSPQQFRAFGNAAKPSFHDQTIRMIAHTTIAGSRVRIELSNAFGPAAVKIGAAHIALREKDSSIVAASDHALTFSGRPSVSIPPGATEVSDPVNLDLPAESDVAVSLFLPDETNADTVHSVGLHTTYVAKGDATAQRAMEETVSQSYYWLANIDVAAPGNAAAIVAFGDSITDGATSTPDTNRSWPSFLAERLDAGHGPRIAVLNQGISGNQVLRDGAGVNALARFDRDVLAQPGVQWMTILESINDIGITLRAGAPAAGAVNADELIAGLKQMIERAHEHGIKVIGCTLTPFEGAAYYSEAGEQVREQVNEWIRSGKAFDAVVDFDAITRDPAHPKQIRPDFNIRDHLHPNDAGYKAMADAIDLSLFGVKAATADPH